MSPPPAASYTAGVYSSDPDNTYESAGEKTGQAVQTCSRRRRLFVTGLSGDENLGQCITLKGRPFRYRRRRLTTSVSFGKHDAVEMQIIPMIIFLLLMTSCLYQWCKTRRLQLQKRHQQRQESRIQTVISDS